MTRQAWIYLIAFIGLLALYAFAFSRAARADELHVMSLDEFSLETGKIVNFEDPYVGFQDPGNVRGEYWDTMTRTRFNLDLFKVGDWGLYWNNTVSGASTNMQYRYVSWSWEGGFDFNKYAQVFWEHDSAHVLDTARSAHFPLYNIYGVRAVLYKRDRQ